VRKIIFVHGAGGTGEVWHYQAMRFPGSDAVTLPGHPHGETRDSIDGYREWLRGHITGQGYGAPILAGQSMGGGIALSYALAHPSDTAGLILIASGARLRVNPAFLKILSDNVGSPPSWYRELAATMYGGVAEPVQGRVLDSVCSLPVSVHLNDFLCCDRFDCMERLPELKMPVLIICGDKDIMTPLKYSRFMAERIPGSRLAVIPDAGHSVCLEKPGEVNKEIEGFVAKIGS
jgi:pimeloyl-ACP methyl ester carboxylesterase